MKNAMDIIAEFVIRGNPTKPFLERDTEFMEISKFEVKYKAEVCQLWNSIFVDDPPHNEPTKVIDAKMKVQRELFFVSVSNDKITGTVMAGYDGHRGWLYSVAVAPDNRRNGIGSRLVKHTVNALRQIGCMKVNLQVRATNTQVIAFYESLGFSTEERVSMGKLLV
jgi:hypothetical protein